MKIALEDWDRYRVKPVRRLRLDSIAADSTDFCDNKKEARKQLKSYRQEIDDLVGVLAAEQQRSLLIVLQGVDASGKDGAIRKVFTGVNPQHCKVASFKEPDREERLHDYLWRIYRALPAKGELGIFNRSQYEDVIVPRARGELAHKDALLRVQQIVNLERAWTQNSIVMRKCFLQISRKEQAARFRARLQNPAKHWKIKESDFSDRKLWKKFISAYETILPATSTAQAPWYIIPADHKWYRDLVIAGIVLAALRSMRPRIPRPKLKLPHVTI